MRKVLARALIASLTVSLTLPAFADFKYTEKSKITGGAMTGAVKMMGVFSKDARQMTNGMNSTTSIKGNRMRRESDMGTAEIYDLDGRRVIQIDSRHKTYSIVTFDEMKAQLEEQQRKAEAQQSKSKDPNAQVKITPKIQMSAGPNTKQLLGLTAKETKMRADMEMQSQDPKHAGETGSFWYTLDAYVAPVKGSDELKNFNTRLAKELNWLPGSMANAAAGGNVQIAPAMVEFQKDVTKLNGMPLLQYVNFGMAGNGQPQQAQPEAKSSTPSSPSGAIAKGIGGLFGKKKKKDDDAAQQTDANSSDSGAPKVSNSLMDMTIEVTSVSNDPVDPSLFDIPQGYKKIDARNTTK
jgi:hypothetical protein